MNKRNMDSFFAKFNSLVSTKELNDEQNDWMLHWKVYLALAIIDDLGRDLSSDICDLINTINACET